MSTERLIITEVDNNPLLAEALPFGHTENNYTSLQYEEDKTSQIYESINQKAEENYKDKLADYIKFLILQDEQPNDREFLMEGIAGLSPIRLVARFIHLNEQMSKAGATDQEINKAFSDIVRLDTEAFAAEFLYRSSVLQTEYRRSNLNGVPSVVHPRYAPNSPLHSHVSLKEREGAVFNGVLNLERAILEAHEHSTVVYGSSSGWNGCAIPFQEAQFHSVNIVDGQILDTTIRLSLTPEQMRDCLETLSGHKFTAQTERELIKEMSQTVLVFPYDFTPQDLLAHVKTVKKDHYAWDRMKLVGGKVVFDKSFTFEQINQVLDRDSFLKTSDEVAILIDNLAKYIEQNANTDEEVLKEMVRQIGKTALTISESVGIEVGELTERKVQNGDFSGATKYASEGLGCDTPTSSQSREAQYAREGIDGTCSQCGESTRVICGWCIKCAEAGGNYKKQKQEQVTQGSAAQQKDNLYGSFLGILIAGVFSTFSKN